MEYRLFKKLEQWLLPPTCVVNGQRATQFDLSDVELLKLQMPVAVCQCCCEPVSHSNICGACLTNPPAFEPTRVGYYFDKPLQTLVYQLKYSGQLSHAKLLAQSVEPYLDASQIDAILPVPIHVKRRKQRGYNQAYYLAKWLGKRMQKPVLENAVVRQQDTPSQTLLNHKQRQQNLANAFAVDASVLQGIKRVAIMDDVITTGATMQRIAQQLKRHTAIDYVEAWAIAKTK